VLRPDRGASNRERIAVHGSRSRDGLVVVVNGGLGRASFLLGGVE
jgi:hypothetical protein